MLEVKVSEISRSLMNRLGFNFTYLYKGPDFEVSLLSELTSIPEIPRFNTLLNLYRGRASWSLLMDILKEEGVAKILAEPTLITTSGQEARFLAGGEIPIPVPEELGRVTISYKPYGVGLIFTPTVLSREKISMRVVPEVSEVDYERVVYYLGWAIPAFKTRRAATTVELADGQSFAIAGLLREDVTQVVSKFPILGDIPVLGALFRSSEFQKNETELVIIVTPHLVKPLDMARQPLPTDAYIEPDDFEFYLLGAMEGREKPVRRPDVLPPQGGMEGEFGHIVPGL